MLALPLNVFDKLLAEAEPAKRSIPLMLPLVWFMEWLLECRYLLLGLLVLLVPMLLLSGYVALPLK